MEKPSKIAMLFYEAADHADVLLLSVGELRIEDDEYVDVSFEYEEAEVSYTIRRSVAEALMLEGPEEVAKTIRELVASIDEALDDELFLGEDDDLFDDEYSDPDEGDYGFWDDM
jgi:hypothetical protein